MAPEQKTNWQLYKSSGDLFNSAMKSWVEENNSLMKRLNDEKQEIVSVSYTHLRAHET